MSGSFSLAGELDLLLPITALVPLTAVLLVSQSNPYQTLVLRGILGSVSTLLYALLGAPDVAITEALVGTLLSTTLYAVALRSSMTLRLSFPPAEPPSEASQALLRDWLEPLSLRLRLLSPEQLDDPGQSGPCHGRLGPGPRLELANPRLVERLQALEGFRRWQQGGGELLLRELP
ncbi:hydrogenase subunit MbhD domain-containing protein [Synechococcus sp. BA-132 BA5]|uniref:hydrogenase subunit MbhD domain-containing protein n=1 Tax=Synechococcus sp. BA-132 BA5 TaxID=3110252 RepID=UPI002B21A92B|nr:hydrogenase subunit MbhD domain-containing protein [Synechococcus sp. BA-132 BA5]MEA5417465.1 hydrogenase subunit MbhD domain-containing protein [Synechococcus sp. BA-132 BA5]